MSEQSNPISSAHWDISQMLFPSIYLAKTMNKYCRSVRLSTHFLGSHVAAPRTLIKPDSHMNIRTIQGCRELIPYEKSRESRFG
jgi:hypothetical protein